MIYDSVAQLVGGTPLMKLDGIKKKYNLKSDIYAKAEFLNPSGSVKDRASLFMLEDAIASGRLKEGGTVIEPTSGNTGIGLAMLCAVKGFKMIVVMPETMSVERRKLISAYGAQVVLTKGQLGMAGTISKAEELNREIPNSIIASQFDNPANSLAHVKTTGEEIWKDLEGKIDVFVASFGTGGTVSGTGKFLKGKNKNVKVVAVEPSASPLVTQGHAGSHAIQGIGAGFVPAVYDSSVVDEVMTVSNDDAMSTTRLLARSEGLLTGISSGAAAWAAAELARREELRDKTIVTLLPDTGERYLSTGVFG